MINLTPRLMAVAEMVETDSVTDVGTDHGKLPIYLALKGKIKKAIASDLNKGPIKACEFNVQKHGVQNIVEVRQSDGLDKFDVNETGTLCIAGMGGELMASILSKNFELACSFNEIILQPMTQIEYLKSYLYNNGFGLLDDVLVREGEKIYNVFKVKYVAANKSFSEVELIVSDFLIRKRDPLLYEYTSKLIKRYKNILKGLNKSESSSLEEIGYYKLILSEVIKINEIAKNY